MPVHHSRRDTIIYSSLECLAVPRTHLESFVRILPLFVLMIMLLLACSKQSQGYASTAVLFTTEPADAHLLATI
jgi:hypothetical protein